MQTTTPHQNRPINVTFGGMGGQLHTNAGSTKVQGNFGVPPWPGNFDADYAWDDGLGHHYVQTSPELIVFIFYDNGELFVHKGGNAYVGTWQYT